MKIFINTANVESIKKASEFGNQNSDLVKFVFMLATTNSLSYMGTLPNLVELLERKEFIKF